MEVSDTLARIAGNASRTGGARPGQDGDANETPLTTTVRTAIDVSRKVSSLPSGR